MKYVKWQLVCQITGHNEDSTLGIVERLTVRFGSDAGVTCRTAWLSAAPIGDIHVDSLETVVAWGAHRCQARQSVLPSKS
jgi:hypothetical protein